MACASILKTCAKKAAPKYSSTQTAWQAFVGYLNQGKDTLNKIIHITKDAGEGIEIEVAMQYNDGYEENLHCFANNIRNRDGGTHLKVSVPR